MTSVDRISLIVVIALLTYGCRLGGFGLSGRSLPAPVERFLTYVPIAAFAALAVPGFAGDSMAGFAPRLLAAVAAAAVTLRFGRLWLCLVVGMSTYWLASAVLP